MSYILLIIGFALLIKSADILIDSASKLAHLLAIPSFIIGFSVIAFGTSAPELAVGIFSGIKQANLITLGDVIGSSIANIALIIGITAVIHPLAIERPVLYKEVPISFAVQLILTIMLLADGVLSRVDALMLLVLFIVFLFYIFKRSKELGLAGIDNTCDEKKEVEAVTAEETEEAVETLEAVTEMSETVIENATEHTKIKLVGLLLLSLIGIVGGGNLIVNSSTEIARMLGLSEVLIGITIVAIGTSLPELVTSVVAALKKQSDLAIGNIIGSNIFNVLFVLGTSAFIYPIPAAEGIGIDIVFMLFSTCFVFLLPLRRKRVSKFGGVMLLALYAIFLIYKILTV